MINSLLGRKNQTHNLTKITNCDGTTATTPDKNPKLIVLIIIFPPSPVISKRSLL